MPLKFKVQDSDNQPVSIVAINKHQTDNTAITLNNLFTITNFEFDDNVTGTIAVTNGTLSSNTFTGTDVSGITLTPVGLTVAGATSTVTVTVNDGVSGHTNVSATATVINGTPVWATAAGSLGSVVETQTFSATVTVTDTNTNTITHTAGALPTGITLTDNGNNTATLSGTAPVVLSDTTFNFTLTTNDGTVSVGRAFSITVTDAVTSWTTPAGTLGTFAELNAVSITVTANNPLATPAITLKSGSLPGGLTLTDNGNGTATIGGTLNTAVSSDTTTTFTLTASALSSTADRTYSITETDVSPVLNAFPVAAIPAGFADTYAVSATQSDGTQPAVTLKTFTTSGQNYQIQPGFYTGGPSSQAGQFFGASPVTQYTENDFTFTDQSNGSANLVISPKGVPYLVDNIQPDNNNTVYNTTAFTGFNTVANKAVNFLSGMAIKFTAIATTPQGSVERTYEVPLHPAPILTTNCVPDYSNAVVGSNPNEDGDYVIGTSRTQIWSKNTTHTVNLGFQVRNYNAETVRTGATFTVPDIQDTEVGLGNTTEFNSFSLSGNGDLSFNVKSSVVGQAALLAIVRDDLNAQRTFTLVIKV